VSVERLSLVALSKNLGKDRTLFDLYAVFFFFLRECCLVLVETNFTLLQIGLPPGDQIFSKREHMHGVGCTPLCCVPYFH
jgi:hypothetical protein